MLVDAGRLADALGTDPAEVIALFTHGTEGLPARLQAAADALTQSDGLIAGREEGLNSRVRSLESQQLRYERRLELVEQRLRAQFTALETLVSQMQSTSSYLTQQLALLQKLEGKTALIIKLARMIMDRGLRVAAIRPGLFSLGAL